MKVSVVLKDLLRPSRDVIFAFMGFMYDFFRFFKYAGWRGIKELDKIDYKAVKIYHRLEKSLSFKNRNRSSGWGAAKDFMRLLENKGLNSEERGYQEIIGIKVLHDFLLSTDAKGQDRTHLEKFLKTNASLVSKIGGVLESSAEKMASGKLDNPEQFFLTRYSVRDFKEDPVPKDLIYRTLQLAMKTPSVCNRQAWHVYHLDRRSSIDRALSLQNGNRGFGHEVPCLIVITSDLKAFDTAGERNQHWIDGGMFSMSIVMALHALGLASCCLNWSKGPVDDIKFRKLINIEDSHSIMMMLAVGYASDDLKVCYSARKPIENIYTHLD